MIRGGEVPFPATPVLSYHWPRSNHTPQQVPPPSPVMIPPESLEQSLGLTGWPWVLFINGEDAVGKTPLLEQPDANIVRNPNNAATESVFILGSLHFKGASTPAK